MIYFLGLIFYSLIYKTISLDKNKIQQKYSYIRTMSIRVYDMKINELDETGVDINSFVQSPAHVRSFETYGKSNKVAFSVDEEKRIVTGVFIMADYLIYRNDKQLGEHYVKFSPETIWAIRNKFFKKGYNVNTNLEHSLMVEGAILVESYIVHSTDPRFAKVPGILSKQNVNDGSWIGSYYIENENLWQDCKNGIFTGFSVEGYFDKVEIKVKKQSMNKNKKTSLFKNIFGASSAENFSEATTVDGTVVFWEGDLAVGTSLMIEVEGEKVAAPEGDHQVDIDGKTFALTVDAEGKVSKMEEVAQMSEEATILSQAIKKVIDDASVKFAAQQKEIDKLKVDLQAAQAGGKFSASGKKSDDGEGNKGGFRNALK